MGLFPEREPVVQLHPEELKLPPAIQEAGIQPVKAVFNEQVRLKGQKIIQTPENQRIELKIPTTSGKLETWSKGSIDDGFSWFAMHWLRQIKKAMHFGWQIIWGGANAS